MFIANMLESAIFGKSKLLSSFLVKHFLHLIDHHHRLRSKLYVPAFLDVVAMDIFIDSWSRHQIFHLGCKFYWGDAALFKASAALSPIS
jgi:hypothetical protein